MEIFVSELPKDCLDCPCYDGEFMRCNLIHCEHSVGYFNEDELDYKHIPINQDFEELICPLKLLSTRLAEERKKVVQEIKKEFEPSPNTTIIEGTPTPEAELVNRGFSVCKKRVYKVLDRIERGE